LQVFLIAAQSSFIHVEAFQNQTFNLTINYANKLEKYINGISSLIENNLYNSIWKAENMQDPKVIVTKIEIIRLYLLA